ncbi:hypothetical protein [Psychrobacter sp.]|uniref:hypothetical protein n=1 Tax=Psychrobacter sp. TaxID=56811 RepID=UPI003BB1A79A
MTTKIKNLREYTMKGDISEHHERIIRDLFNALFVTVQSGLQVDHTPNIIDIMTLDICQVQHLMIQRREGDYDQYDIVSALRNLEYPKIIIERDIGITYIYSGFNGKQIAAIRLDYGPPPSFKAAPTEDIAAELAQVDLVEAPVDEIDKCDASRRWIDYAMTLEQQYAVDQKTIANLRAVITELSSVLYEVDADARISITSIELLDLIQSNRDIADTPF